MANYFSYTCNHCSKEFLYNRPSRPKKYCCKECKDASQVKLREHTKCLYCGQTLKSHQQKFCSSSCSAVVGNKTRDINSRIKQRKTLSKKLTSLNKNKTPEKELYKRRCIFKFSPYNYPFISGYDLLLENGIYHPKKNLNGVCRDHIVSIEYGWRNNIPPEIMSHPANCQLLLNKDNIKKSSDCWMTMNELKIAIANWSNN